MAGTSAIRPVEVGDPYRGTEGTRLHDWRRTAAIGGAAAVLGAALWHWRPRTRRQREKNQGKSLLGASLAGGAAGLLAALVTWVAEERRGTDYSHSYRDPEEIKRRLKPGESPHLQVVFAGAGNGPHQGKEQDYPLKFVNGRFGENRVLLVNPHDKSYAHEYIRRFRKTFPEGTVDVFGHSDGGTAAYDEAVALGKEGIPVRRLLTMDSIYRLGNREARPATVARWDNYVPTKANWRWFGDLVALVGGRGHTPRGAVNHRVSTPKWNNHWDIKTVPVDAPEEMLHKGPGDRDAGANFADNPENWWVPNWMRRPSDRTGGAHA